MLDQILDQLDPLLSELIYAAILSLITGTGWFGLTLKRLLETKQAQTSLHLALDTGVDWVTDQIARLLSGQIQSVNRDKLAAEIVDYVKGSVPGALKVLKPDDRQLLRMAEAKINSRFLLPSPTDVGGSDPDVDDDFDEVELTMGLITPKTPRVN